MLGNSFDVKEETAVAESLGLKQLGLPVEDPLKEVSSQELMEEMEHMDNTEQGIQHQGEAQMTVTDDAKVQELLSALCAAEATLAQLSSPSKKPLEEQELSLPLPEEEIEKATNEVDSDIHDLQSSLESIKNQLDLLEGKKESEDSASTPSSPNNRASSSKRKRVSLSNEGSPIPRAPPRRLPTDPEERKEHVRRSRATPLHEGFRCEYCSDAETPMWRTGPSGPRTLCNKCGVKWRAGRIMTDTPPPPSDRPPRVRKPRPSRAGGSSSSSRASRSSTYDGSSSAPKNKKRVISLAQKLAMANAISNPNIDEDVLIHVVETIRASLPGLQKNEEVEIDMDKLGNGTLTRLYDYLQEEGILNM